MEATTPYKEDTEVAPVLESSSWSLPFSPSTQVTAGATLVTKGKMNKNTFSF